MNPNQSGAPDATRRPLAPSHFSPAMGLPLPQVVHLGFAKAASTFLQAFFWNHPQVHLVFKANHFGPFDKCSFEQGPEHYARKFADAKPGELRIESDEHLIMPVIHPQLGVRCMTEESIHRLLDRLDTCIPESKLIVVLRNQPDMILSTYSQYLLGGGTLAVGEFARKLVEPQADGQQYFAAFFARIIEQIRKYHEGELLVLLLEDFKSDTRRVLQQICQFLELDELNFEGSFRSRRISLSPNAQSLLRQMNHVMRMGRDGRYDPILSHNRGLYHRLCNALRVVDHVLLRRLPHRPAILGDDVTAEIHELFAPDNRKLMDLLQRDLRPLGYHC
jgi:hypothetical protein